MSANMFPSYAKKLQPFDEFPPIVERVKTHMKSPIQFDLQVARPAITSMNVHESRFSPFNDNPKISGKFRRVVSPSFSKAPGRKSTNLDVSKYSEYTPKIDVVKDRSGSGSPEWKTKVGRRSIVTACTDVMYHVNYRFIDRQVLVPNFRKAVSRPIGTLEKLPAFMISINSRQGLRQINEKSLIMNKSPEIEYYLPDSSFVSSKSSKLDRSMKQSKSSPRH